MEQTCRDMGLSMTTAFTIFATKVTKEKRIPFDVAVDPDPFYSEVNMERLRRGIEALNNGKGIERELIAVDGE